VGDWWRSSGLPFWEAAASSESDDTNKLHGDALLAAAGALVIAALPVAALLLAATCAASCCWRRVGSKVGAGARCCGGGCALFAVPFVCLLVVPLVLLIA
jgi:hypothetical protein